MILQDFSCTQETNLTLKCSTEDILFLLNPPICVTPPNSPAAQSYFVPKYCSTTSTLVPWSIEQRAPLLLIPPHFRQVLRLTFLVGPVQSSRKYFSISWLLNIFFPYFVLFNASQIYWSLRWRISKVTTVVLDIYGLVGFLLVIKRLPRPAIPDVCYRHLDVERPSQRWGCFPLSPLFSSWFVFLFLEGAEFSVGCK